MLKKKAEESKRARDEKIRRVAEARQQQEKKKFEERFSVLHNKGDIAENDDVSNDDDKKGDMPRESEANPHHSSSLPSAADIMMVKYVDYDDVERIMKEIKDMTLSVRTKTLEGRLKLEIEKLRDMNSDLRIEIDAIRNDVKLLLKAMKVLKEKPLL